MKRVGVVGFANALPLTHELEGDLGRALIVRTTPAEIVKGLESGTMELGLVPVMALPGNPAWGTVGGLGIAAEGPVQSVILVSRVPVAKITRLVEDPASRTSNLLARLWLKRVHGVEPEIVPGVPEPEARLALGDATVVIGDDALFLDPGNARVIDLAGAWKEWTGLPFVFAVWAGPAAADEGLSRALHSCYRKNAERLDELAALASRGRPERREPYLAYLSRSIRYPVGEREEAGLRRFLDWSAEEGWIPSKPQGVSHVQLG